jgi:hypothetical protein
MRWGGMRSGKSTALRGWTGCGITETLRALITLKGLQRFQWSQWLSGGAQIDEPVNEGVTHKLTLVSAPAGFGKTTLLSEWASHFGLAIE